MDEIPSELADLEMRTLSKACLTSEGRTVAIANIIYKSADIEADAYIKPIFNAYS